MKIVVLVDNTSDPHNKNLCTEHGLSIYFEFDNCKWLFDTGASGYFYSNAQKLDINIPDVDYLILSHGHADHTGGLSTFIDVNKKAKIFLSDNIKDKKFISYSKGTKRSISTDYSVIENNIQRFIFIDSITPITQNTKLICNISHNYLLPKANNKLFAADYIGECVDKFKHEIILTVNTSKGLIVFSGCSHNGILNILSACSANYQNIPLYMCIGGMHLPDSTTKDQYESDTEIEVLANTLKNKFPDMTLLTGHCTGIHPNNILKNTLGDNFDSFYTGFEIEF